MFEVELEFMTTEKYKVRAKDSSDAEDEAMKVFYAKYPNVPKATVSVLAVEEIDG
jgi:hypothetical protein